MNTIQELELIRMQQQPAVEPAAIAPEPTTKPPLAEDHALRNELGQLHAQLQANNYRISTLGWTEPGDLQLARLQLERNDLTTRISEIESQLSGR